MDGQRTPKRINADEPNLMLQKQPIHIRRIFCDNDTREGLGNTPTT